MAVIPHFRHTLRGVIGSVTQPVETWSFHFATTNDPTVVANADFDAYRVATGNSYVTNLAPLFSSNVVLTEIRTADIGADNRTTKNSSGEYRQLVFATNVPGTAAQAAGGRMPLQTALCASLSSTLAGAAGKGRMFLPWPDKYGLGTDYRLSTTDSAAIAASVKAFLNGVAAGPASDIRIVGATSSITGKPATLATVTGVKVGRAPDTMRSRRGNLIEGYSVLSL